MQETWLKCLTCENNEYTHEFATILEIRLKEDFDGDQITIMNIDNKLSSNTISLKNCEMKNRRNNCYHLIACENCNKVQSICVYQHKGLTIIENQFPLTIPYIPCLTFSEDKYIYWGGFSICNDGQ